MKGAIIATALLTSVGTAVLIHVPTWLKDRADANRPMSEDLLSTGAVPYTVTGGRVAPSLADQPFPLNNAGRPEARSVQVAQAGTASGNAAPAAQPAQPGAAAPVVDETALRYFARQGDQRRLDAEIARLKALYPNWEPPADPAAVPPVGNAQLDAMWKLYAQGRYAELRKAISDRKTADPAWQEPPDLLDRLSAAEAREQLINASNLKQYATVVRTASENPSLLTCGEVDVMWRVAEAFAETERPERARDAYKYILDNCTDANERVATVEKAIPLLPRPLLDQLLALEKTGSDGKGEFAPARLALSRAEVAKGGEDPKLNVAQSDVDAVSAVANASDGSASDARLLGWYYIRRDRAQEAETWFRKANDREPGPEAAQGLALALIGLERPGDAEGVLYEYRDATDDIKQVYQAASANLLATEPRIAIDPTVLQRMSVATGETRDPAAAQQFGWYARDLNQHPAAAQWFRTALSWKPDDEASAYGLVLTLNQLGDTAGVREIQRQWAGRSERIANLGEARRTEDDRPRLSPELLAEKGPDARDLTAAYGRASISRQPPAPQQNYAPLPERQQPAPAPAPAPQPQQPVELTPPSPDRFASSPNVVAAAPVPERQARAAPSGGASQTTRAPQGRGCSASDNYSQLTGQAALARGWCLMDLNRPLEAVQSFERALETGNDDVRRDAAWGQSLAYLRRNMVDDAAVAATKAPQPGERSRQLDIEILTQRATGFFEQKRYVEALIALDQRARIAPERRDLMALRGYAYLNLRRPNDARKVFQALAAVGDKEGFKGLAAVNPDPGN